MPLRPARRDIKMKMIPGWLMDFMLKHFAKMFLPMMFWQSKKFEPEGELEHLMETKAASFAQMDRRLGELGSSR